MRAIASSGSARSPAPESTRACLKGGTGAKIRVAQNVDSSPGRYRVTAYLRGLDIGKGTYNCTTEFMFDGKYQQLNKNGTFGWTKLTYVGADQGKQADRAVVRPDGPRLFLDRRRDARKSGRRRSADRGPVLADEEAPIAPPARVHAARRALRGMRIPEQSGRQDLLRLWHRAECGKRHRRGATGPADRHV